MNFDMLKRVSNLREKLLTVRVRPEVLKDFKIAAEVKGGTMSGLIHMFVVQTIRDQKERNPEAFSKHQNNGERPVIRARIQSQKKKQRKK